MRLGGVGGAVAGPATVYVPRLVSGGGLVVVVVVALPCSAAMSSERSGSSTLSMV